MQIVVVLRKVVDVCIVDPDLSPCCRYSNTGMHTSGGVLQIVNGIAGGGIVEFGKGGSGISISPRAGAHNFPNFRF